MMTWAECIDAWLAAVRSRSGSEHSVRAYRDDVRLFELWHGGWEDVDGATCHAWVRLLRTVGNGPATINRRVAALRSLYRFAATETGRNPLWPWPNPWASRTLIQRVDRRLRLPTADQITRLLGAIDRDTIIGKRDYAMIGGLFLTARRLSEWSALRWGDVHVTPDGWWIEYVGKGHRNGQQALPPALAAAIEEWLRAAGHWPPQPDDYIFVSCRPAPRWERHLHPGQVWRRLVLYNERSGVPCHPHTLRHIGARVRRAAGADVWELQKLLNHSHLNTTEIYTASVLDVPDPDRYAAAVEAFLPPVRAETHAI